LMLNNVLIPVAMIYVVVVGLLFAYGVNFFYLTYLAWKDNGPDPVKKPPERLPTVTVQLPIYNEMYVAERLVKSAARLDYPSELLEIQVLDDSTDETGPLLQKVVDRLRAKGINIRRIHRTDRKGYKAGALAAALDAASGEYIAYFDADFVPPPDFLKKVIPHFDHPKIAFIQTRWGHLNRNYSLLTLLQSLAIDAHFMVEQFARSHNGYWFNFNGTAGVWRKTAIIDAGGWKADTLTEDLDLSYRAFMRGWQAVYLRDVVVPAELPVTFSAYRRQQHRWARGSLECALKLVPQVWQTDQPLNRKLEATLHLTGYGVHLLLFLLTVLYPMVLLIPHTQNLTSLFGVAAVFNLTAAAPSLLFASAQRMLGRNWFRLLPSIVFMTFVGAGMMVNTLWAGLQIFRKKAAIFERTPKFGVEGSKVDWAGRKYQLRLDPVVYLEMAFMAWNACTTYLAAISHNWGIAFYAGMFAVGLAFASSFSIVQAMAVHRRQVRPVQVSG
jgi:cellulose synthase/poly-beta-1,6-N-acetylglucosamine synthase-like glycosyltransferase